MIAPLSHDAAALFERAADGDIEGAVDLVTGWIDRGDDVLAVIDALADAQRRVGQLWYEDEWSVADEHAATAVVDAALAVVQRCSRPRAGETGPTVVVACPEGEWHAMPARMLATSLTSLGSTVRFLGASMPADHLARHLTGRPAELVALSVSTPLALPAAMTMIDAVHSTGTPVVVGGAALGPDNHRARSLGADGWAPSAQGLLSTPLARVARTGATEGRNEREHALFTRQLDRQRLVDASMDALADDFPALARFDDRQLARTRQDFDDIAQFAEVSLLVEDQRLLDDFVRWLQGLLVARGVARNALAVSLRAMVSVTDDPSLHRALEQASARLQPA